MARRTPAKRRPTETGLKYEARDTITHWFPDGMGPHGFFVIVGDSVAHGKQITTSHVWDVIEDGGSLYVVTRTGSVYRLTVPAFSIPGVRKGDGLALLRAVLKFGHVKLWRGTPGR